MAFSAAEAAVYDRQIRIWGVDAQRRLRSSSVLVIGMSPALGEACKNMVLAGVGSLTLLDDGTLVTPSHIASNFLVATACATSAGEDAPAAGAATSAQDGPGASREAGGGAGEEKGGEGKGGENSGVRKSVESVACACRRSLQELNPMVSVQVQEFSGSWDDPSLVAGFSAVVSGLGSLSVEKVLSGLCRGASPPVPFFSLTTRGGRYGRLVADLISHSWRPKPKDSTKDPLPAKRQKADPGANGAPPLAEEVTVVFPPFEEVVSAPFSGAPASTPALHYAFRLAEDFEGKRKADLEASGKEGPEAEELAKELQASASQRLSSELAGVPAGASKRTQRRHQALVADALNLAQALFLCSLQQASAAEACEGPGFAAILGGITAQEVIRLVSISAIVVNNVLYFDNDSCAGQVVRIGDTK